MRLVRPALLLAAVAGLVLASPGSAATTPGPSALTITDPSGDALTGAAHDITKVVITTAGTKTRVRGKTVYTPKDIVVKMTIAGTFSSTPGVNYEVDADLSGCGYVHFTYTPGATLEGGLFTECGSPEDPTTGTSTLYDAPPTVTGNTVTWQFNMKGLSAEFKPGATFSNVHALTNQNDPATGILGAGIVGLNLDDASTDKSFKIA